MPASLSALLTNLLVLTVLAGVLALGLRVLQGVFGTGSKRAAAGEAAARLVALPAGSDGVLRRRFVRAVTSQHVVMPSGERLALASLVVRVAPEDLVRLDPDEDVERLGADAARLYETHARREGWTLPARVSVHVRVDPALRSGWVPPARAGAAAVSGTAAPEPGLRDAFPGWEVLDPGTPEVPADPPTTQLAAVPDAPGTLALGPADPEPLCLEADGRVVEVPHDAVSVLGRLPGSLLPLPHPEVSFRHASLRRFRGAWQVKDLDSTNGTTLDGEPLAPGTWTTVRPGSELALAGVRVAVTVRRAGTVRVLEVPTLR